jgi:RecA-family ATPase
VHFVPYEGKMVKMEVELPRNSTILELKRAVGQRMGVDPSKVSNF